MSREVLQELVTVNVALAAQIDEALKGKNITMVCVLVKGESFTYSTNIVDSPKRIAEVLRTALNHFEGKK